MIVQRLSIPDVLLIEPDRHHDHRGIFCETWSERWANAHGLPREFPQDNYSLSTHRHTIRGLHMQLGMGKLVRVLHGAIWDVAVDARPGCATFGRWVRVHLTAKDFNQLWIPPGFFHGILTLEPNTEIAYKCSALYIKGAEIGVHWDDPDLDIRLDCVGSYITISGKDARLPSWADYCASIGAGNPYQSRSPS